MNGRGLREWLLSHLAWEGFKWIILAATGTAVFATIRVAVGWATGHRSVLQAIFSVLGVIIVVAVAVAQNRAMRIRPRLEMEAPRPEGLYDIAPNAVGLTVPVTNEQLRFHTVAHNVRASLTFSHVGGDVVKVSPALWVLVDPTNGQRTLTERVSIAMGEKRLLLILFWHNERTLSFVTTDRAPLVHSTASPLIPGQWKVKVVLKGDNVTYVSRNNLSLQPNSVTMKPK